MTQFDYIIVLVSVIVGLGVVHLLSGASRFLTDRGEWKPYWVHLLWTGNVFQFLVFFWWFVYRWKSIPEWSLMLFFFVLLYSVVLYLLCAVLFPHTDDRRDFREIYFDNKSVFFYLWILVIIIDFMDTHLKEHYGLSGFGIYQYVTYGITIVCSIICARSSNPKVHAAWGILFFALMFVFEYNNFSVLRAN